MIVHNKYALKYLFIGCVISSGLWIIGISLYLHGEKKLRVETNAHTLPYDDDDNRRVGNYVDLGIVKSSEDLRKRDDGYSRFSFNLLVSDRIGLKRKLPDTRHKLYVMLLFSILL